jgi:hypothetical protein
MKNPSNSELRLAIITKDVKAGTLPKLDTLQLAPKELKQMRDEREQKYMKEQVLLQGNHTEGIIIAKTHKVKPKRSTKLFREKN